MGRAKERLMEQQARGWDSIDKFACQECFEDPDIRKFIREIASEHKCSYCGMSSADKPIAAAMNEVMPLIMDGIRLEWGDPSHEGMPWETQEGGWLGEVWDTEELFEEIEFFTANDELLKDICEAIRVRQWCRRYLYGELPQQALISTWKYFCELVTHRIRFVFYKMQDDSKRSYGGQGPVPPHLILDTLGKLVQQMKLITAIPAGTEFFRARVLKKDKVYSTIHELGPPPATSAQFSNRMSPAGIPMFYGARESQTAVKEVAYGVRYPAAATVGTFVTSKEFKVLDLTKRRPVPGLFNRAKHEIRPARIFLNAFVDDLTKPVVKDGQEHVDYVPSQVVTEYFRHIFRDDNERPIHGILYPSAVNNGGTSCVLFFGAADDQKFVDRENAIDQWMILKSKKKIAPLFRCNT